MQTESLSGVQVVIAILLLVFGPGGATFVGLRLGLNGLRNDVREIKTDVKGLIGSDGEQNERHARTETRLDNVERIVERRNGPRR